MNGFQMLALAWKRQKSNIDNLAMIILLIFLFFMAEIVAVTLFCPYLEKWIIREKMGQELSQWGVLTYTTKNDWDAEWERQAVRFQRELVDEHIVEQIGDYGTWGMQDEALRDIIDIQNELDIENSDSVNNPKDYLCAYYTWDISLFDDDWLDDEQLKDVIREDDFILLLGSAYDKIEDQTIYESVVDEKRRYVVAGHFPPGYIFFSKGMDMGTGVLSVLNMADMDEIAVMILPDEGLITSATNFFYSPAGVTEQVMEKIKNRADSYGIDVSLVGLGTRFDKWLSSVKEENAYTLPFFFLIFAAALAMVVSCHLIDLMLNRRKYGIYYALGITDKDIAGILFFEGLIRSVLAMLPSGFGFVWFYRMCYGKGSTVKAFDRAVFFTACASMLLTACVLLAVSAFVTYIILKRKQVNNLLVTSKF